MSFRGLDISPGLAKFGDLMAQGYKDRAELEDKRRIEAQKLQQEQFENSIKSRDADERYGDITLPASVAQTLQDPNLPYQQFKSGYGAAKEYPPPPPRSAMVPTRVQESPGRRPASGAVVNGRMTHIQSGEGSAFPGTPYAGEVTTDYPYSPPAPQPQQQDARPQAMAQAIQMSGVRVNPDGSITGRPKQMEMLADIYNKAVGSAAAAFAQGVKTATPPPPPPRGPAPRAPAQPRETSDQKRYNKAYQNYVDYVSNRAIEVKKASKEEGIAAITNPGYGKQLGKDFGVEYDAQEKKLLKELNALGKRIGQPPVGMSIEETITDNPTAQQEPLDVQYQNWLKKHNAPDSPANLEAFRTRKGLK